MIDVATLRRLYAEGRNIMEWLREQQGVSDNEPDIIRASYDLQTGSYIASLKNAEAADLQRRVGAKFARLFDELEAATLLEAGAGELTTLVEAAAQMTRRPAGIAAFDISLSRVGIGRQYAGSRGVSGIAVFTGLLQSIPLVDDSVDVVFTSHAIEPNRGAEETILRELHRVARRFLVLREPSWELGDERTRARIDQHRYINNLMGACRTLGLKVVEHARWELDSNPSNQAALTVIEKAVSRPAPPWPLTFASPLSRRPLHSLGGHLYNDEDGLVFPVVAGIPCLLPRDGLLATHYPAFAGDEPLAPR